MPNWCENEWSIYCDDEKTMQEIKSTLLEEVTDEDGNKREQLTYNKLIPIPEILKRTVSHGRNSKQIRVYDLVGYDITEDEHRDPTDEERAEIEAIGYTNWYDWSIDHWGVKWDASDSRVVEDEPPYLDIHFMSPWGPPDVFVQKFREKWPDASISAFYREPGLQFAGYL